MPIWIAKIMSLAGPSILAFVFSCVIPGLCFAAAGDLDTTFNGTGKVVMSFSADIDAIDALALQTDGKIIAAGRQLVLSPQSGSFVIVRFNPNGSVDTSFGLNGVVRSDFGYQFASPYAIALQPDGKFIVAGSGTRFLGAFDSQAIIARYLADGTLDKTFHHDGFIEEFYGLSGTVRSVVIQPDGKIVVAGTSAGDTFAIRYNSDGTRDRRFGHGGKAILPFSADGDGARTVKLRPDAKLVILGAYAAPLDAVFMLRVQAHGKIDTSFDADGKQTISFGSGRNFAFDCEIQPDGKLVIGGHYGKGESSPLAMTIARLNQNGSFDDTFDGDGKVVIDPAGLQEALFDIAIQADGKIVMGGSVRAGQGFNDNFLLRRRNPDGSPDLSFGQAGRVQTNMTASSNQIRALLIQPDGKIVAGGSAANDFALARYLGQ